MRRRVTVVVSRGLEIVAVAEGDSGVYMCTANGVSANFTLTIEDTPDGTYIYHIPYTK